MSKNSLTGKKVYQETLTIVDEDGVLKKEVDRKIVNFPKEPSYVKLYLEDLTHLLDLPKVGNLLLYELIKKMDFEGSITLTKFTRDRMSKNINTSSQTIMNNVTELVKKGVMKRLGRCEYEMNPNFFAKGDWSDIHKRREEFELKITYKNGKRLIKGRAFDDEK